MKHIISIFLLFASLPSLAEVSHNLPTRTIEDVSDGIVVTYSFENPEIVESEYYENTKYIRYDGFGLSDNDGEPCIPFRNDTYLVPNDCAVTVSVLDSAYVDTTFVLSPSMPLIPDDKSPITMHSITPYIGFFPTNTIQSSGVYQHRKDALINVSVFPVKYNYQAQTLRRYSYIKYKLTYTGASRVYKGKCASLARKICQNTPYSRNIADNTIRDDRHYLIVTTTEYKSSLEDFVMWKRLKGYNVQIACRPKGYWTVQSVTDSIQSHFTADSIKYILIVGDIDDVPAQTFVSVGKTGVTDLQYGLPQNTSSAPQIRRGRIPVNNTTELSIILNKIMKYEKTPIIDNTFYNTALHLAQFMDGETYVLNPKPKDGYEDVAFTLCAENLRNYMVTHSGKDIIRGYVHEDNVIPTNWNKSGYSDGTPIPIVLTDSLYHWEYTSNDIKNAIEAGVFYVLYRGHGEEGNWFFPDFSGNQTLTNGDKLPFIFSIACYTGRYNYQYSDCMTEKFLKKQGGGCVGMIAATHQSFSGYNDAMAFGIFDAIWPGFIPLYKLNLYSNITYDSSTYEVGEIMDLGLLRMKETWGNYSLMWQRYHCFCDPSMMLYTENPQLLQAPIIHITNDSLYINVFDEGCRINVFNNSTNEVCSYLGDNVVQYVGNDDISLCIDKHNYVPYVWKKDIYIQNELIISSDREYNAQNVKVGNHVTDQKPQGNVNITNSKITISAQNVLLDKGTIVNLGSILKINPSH